MSIGLPRLIASLHSDLQGTDLNALRVGAEQLGFSAAAGTCKPAMFDKIPLPAIAHFKDVPGGHFVTIYKIGHTAVTVADPARGIVKLRRDEFMARWSGAVLLLSKARVRSSRVLSSQPVFKLLALARSHRDLLGPSVVCAFAVTVLGLAGPWFMQFVVDRILPRAEWSLLNGVFLGVVAFSSLQAGLSLARQYLLCRVGYRVEMDAGSAYVRHILSLPVGFIEGRCTGELVSRINDVDAISRSLTTTLLDSVVDILLVLFALASVAFFDLRLAGIVSAFIPISALIAVVLQRPLLTLQDRARDQTACVYNRLFDSFAAVRTVKAFTAEPVVHRRFEQSYRELRETFFRVNLLHASVATATASLAAIAGLVVIRAGTGSIRAGEVTLGQLLFFYSLLAHVLGPVQRLAGSWGSLQEAIVGMDRMSSILEVEPEQDEGNYTAFDKLRGEIEFRDVSLQYRSGYAALSGVSFRIPAGERVFIVGETGSGKTSIANLILGLYKPTSGAVLIDGHDSRGLSKAALRGRMAVVFQDAALMNETIQENIMLGRPGASFAEVQEAAELAKADEFVRHLPKQYQYEVGERGHVLSSGQQQRIAIARALLRRADVLILDEATSNLDVSTERSVMTSIRAVRENSTTVIVTHRLANIRASDAVIVMGGGQVLESGLQIELLRQGGAFAKLWHGMRGEVSGPVDGPAVCMPPREVGTSDERFV